MGMKMPELTGVDEQKLGDFSHEALGIGELFAMRSI
jgi:hypothetical protein